MPHRMLKKVTFSGRLTIPKDEVIEEYNKTVFKAVVFMVIDIVIVLGISVALFFLFAGKAIEPYERALPCSDLSLRKPFYPNTVDLKHLLLVSLGSPFVVIAMVEGVLFHKSKGTNKLAKFFATTTLVYLKYLLIYAACTFAMEFIKCKVGRLRPHFVAACAPDWTKVDCSVLTNMIEPADLACTNPDKRRIRTARTSFPSGHTAAAFLAFTFLTIYLHRMAKATNLKSVLRLRNILLPIYGIWTLFTSMSRVTDCWHHPTDVLGGVLLALACVLPVYISSWDTTADVYETRDVKQEAEKID